MSFMVDICRKKNCSDSFWNQRLEVSCSVLELLGNLLLVEYIKLVMSQVAAIY